MIAWLIQYLIAGACILFVVSLPLQQTMLAKTLRRFAGAALLLAFAPALFFGLVPTASSASAGTAAAPSALRVGLALAVLSALAYGVLEIRKRMGGPKRDAWAEYVNLRSSGKTTVREQERKRRPPQFAGLQEEDEDDVV